MKLFANFAWLILTFGSFAFSVCGQENATNYYNRATSERDKGDYDKAIADFTQVINLNSNYVAAYDDRSFTKERKGDYDGAVADAAKAIKMNPKYAPAYNHRGIIKDEKKDYKGALADYNIAIKFPSWPARRACPCRAPRVFSA